MIKENLVNYFQESIIENWNKPAFSDFKGKNLNFSEVGNNILKIHSIFQTYGIKEGDKIALIGKNSSDWAVVYLATISYGAVIVPVLPDFKPKDFHEIINHSDSVLLFIGEQLFETIEADQLPSIKGILAINDYKLLNACKSKDIETNEKLLKLISEIRKEVASATAFKLPYVGNEALALISYTSGTTGHSKGVMLLHNSLAANVRYGRNNMPLESGDKIVSFLPLAHAYGMVFEFLFPFTRGCHITFLTKTPSPQIITEAFAEIKPRLILSVPLVIEKIYKKRLLPTINKGLIKFLMAVPGINKILFKSICKKLSDVFGGNFQEIIIGGAPFNSDAERFFKKINFKFTVGYGMTECGPLISYASWDTTKLQASGRPVDTLEVKIDSEDPYSIDGEILVKGDNVMTGYYKNEEATKAAIDKEGWLHTGDLGIIDKQNNIFIKGRSKNMILGSSGQNIYPEEIESLLNNMQCVSESLVIEEKGKLIALIFADNEVVDAEKIDKDKLYTIMHHNIKELNQHIPAYMQVAKFEFHDAEFEKTPKRSIKRFLYQRD